MVRASKSEKQSTQSSVTTPVVANPETVLVSSTSKKSEKSASSKPKKVSAPKSTEQPVEPVVSVAPVVEVESVAPTTDVPNIDIVELSNVNKLTEFSAKLQQLSSMLSSVKSDFKLIEKSVSRELKIAQKNSSKKKKNAGNRKPSGFVKPTLISDELAEFLGKTSGTEMARTEVSKEINAYIRTNGLQDKLNGRRIIPDVSLTKILNIKNEEELTYFNLQKYMKHHFIKPAGVVATA